MNPDDELDEQLRAALRAEDAELLARLDRDPGIFDVMAAGFRGRTAWWALLVSAVQVVVFALAVWAGFGFFAADTPDERTFWGVCLLLAAMATGMLKLMLFNHAERNLLRRELKRLELQVATLSLRLEQSEG